MGRPKKILSQTPVVTKKYTQITGSPEIITSNSDLWHSIMSRIQKTAKLYGFSRIETPVLEDVNLYKNYFGESAVQLQNMLTSDIQGKTWAIRPAMHPGVLRSYFQNKVYEAEPLSKWGYIGNIQYSAGKNIVSDFEYGFEVLGNFTHLTEAQSLAAVWSLLDSLGLTAATIEVNFMGQTESQSAYGESLKDFLKQKKYELCDACTERLEARVLDILRCGELDCQTVVAEAPTSLDYLDDASHKHFTNTLEALDELQIPYQLNPLLVGPAGVTNTVAVFKQKNGEKTTVIGEAGYHTDLMRGIAGRSLACFGFMGTLSTLKELIGAQEFPPSKDQPSEVFLVPLGELAAKKSLRLFKDLLHAHIEVYDHFGNAGVKNQLKLAETYKSPIALIMGQKEAVDETVILRDVKSGMQEMFSYDKIVDEVKKRLGK